MEDFCLKSFRAQVLNQLHSFVTIKTFLRFPLVGFAVPPTTVCSDADRVFFSCVLCYILWTIAHDIQQRTQERIIVTTPLTVFLSHDVFTLSFALFVGY